MSDMSFKYKKYVITFMEWREKWDCDFWELEDVSLKKLKQKIDAKIKAECVFKNIPCLVKSWGGHVFKATITSVCGDGDSKYIWVKNEKGKRSKEQDYHVFELSDANIELFKKLDALDKEKIKAGNQYDKLSEQLIPIDMNKDRG